VNTKQPTSVYLTQTVAEIVELKQPLSPNCHANTGHKLD